MSSPGLERCYKCHRAGTLRSAARGVPVPACAHHLRFDCVKTIFRNWRDAIRPPKSLSELGLPPEPDATVRSLQTLSDDALLQVPEPTLYRALYLAPAELRAPRLVVSLGHRLGLDLSEEDPEAWPKVRRAADSQNERFNQLLMQTIVLRAQCTNACSEALERVLEDFQANEPSEWAKQHAEAYVRKGYFRGGG